MDLSGCVGPDGHLELRGDPGPWIENNLASRLLVRSLELNLGNDVELIGDSIGQLTELISLIIYNYNSLKCLPDTIASLSKLESLEFAYNDKREQVPLDFSKFVSLRTLSFRWCHAMKSLPDSVANLSKLTSLSLAACSPLTELPSNLGLLRCLTHLSLSYCHGITKLPDNLGQWRSLTHLSLSYCHGITKLPDNLGQWRSLTHLSLSSCKAITELPSNLGQLMSLTHLSLSNCKGITKLPENLKILDLKLQDCCIQFLPKGLINLKHLDADVCTFSKKSLSNLKDSVSLEHLSFWRCVDHKNKKIAISPANLNQFANLKILSLQSPCTFWGLPRFILPVKFEGLAKLCLVDIRKTKNRCLDWSITKLPQLRHLMLPEYFRLQTLPNELKDSVIISVDSRHVRKPWEELKEEMGIMGPSSIPVGAQHPSIIYPPGYLQLKGDPWRWINKNCNSLMLVKFLELNYVERKRDSVENMTQLSELTHLYINRCSNLRSNYYVTDTRLRHLSLQYCGHKFLSHILRNDSLSKLTNLETLHLDLTYATLSANINLPVSLKCLSLRGGNMKLLHDSLVKLLNLKTMDLFKCHHLDLLPANLKAKVRLIDCFIESLPTDLRHLEILFCNTYSFRRNFASLENCLYQLVNLETLSVTCYEIKSFPSIARLHNLEKLRLKDCFSLKELPPNLDELVKLWSLDISGTRIKCLPDSMMLPNLKQLILPKCFERESLSGNLEKVSIIDETEEVYYESMGYYDSQYQTSTETFNEGNDITGGCIEGVGGIVSEETEQEDVPGGSCYESNATLPILGVDETVIAEQTSAHDASNISNVGYSEQITSEQNAMSQVYRDSNFNGGRDLVIENSQYVSCGSQIQFSSSGNEYSFTYLSNFITGEPISSLSKTCSFDQPVNNQHAMIDGRMDSATLENEVFPGDTRSVNFATILDDFCSQNRDDSNSARGESNHAIQNNEMDTMTTETEQMVPFDTNKFNSGGDNIHDLENGQNQIPQNDDMKDQKKRENISLEMIQDCWSRKMTLKNAAKEFGVSRSTLKRRLKDLDIPWQSSRKEKQVDAKKRKLNIETPRSSDSSQQNVVNPTNPAVHSDNVVNNSTQNATSDAINLMATQCECTSPNSLQRNERSSTFIVKATYKKEKARFKFSLSSNIDLLKEELGERLELEANTFKIRYQDDEGDWVLITYLSDLEQAVEVSKSSGSSIVRLLIVPKT